MIPEGQEQDPNYESDDEIIEDEDDFCSIPKKPKYDVDDTAETFQQKEIDSFFKWKRSLARLQAKNPSVSFEKKNFEINLHHALCSRNFQNVKLRQHVMESLRFDCNSDFT